MPRKPHPMGSKYHSICWGVRGIINAIELVKGKDFSIVFNKDKRKRSRRSMEAVVPSCGEEKALVHATMLNRTEWRYLSGKCPQHFAKPFTAINASEQIENLCYISCCALLVSVAMQIAPVARADLKSEQHDSEYGKRTSVRTSSQLLAAVYNNRRRIVTKQ